MWGSIDRQRPVIVAMPIMDMVQPTIDQIIDMVAVRHRFMATIRPVHMATGHFRCAAIGIGRRNGDDVLIDMIAVDMMEMAIMQIIDMAIMVDGSVAAARAVDMGVISVDVAAHALASRKGSTGSPGNGCSPT
jgi:hypothetical protein